MEIITVFNEEEEIRNFSAQTDAFSFWVDEQEDIYRDYLEPQEQNKI